MFTSQHILPFRTHPLDRVKLQGLELSNTNILVPTCSGSAVSEISKVSLFTVFFFHKTKSKVYWLEMLIASQWTCHACSHFDSFKKCLYPELNHQVNLATSIQLIQLKELISSNLSLVMWMHFSDIFRTLMDINMISNSQYYSRKRLFLEEGESNDAQFWNHMSYRSTDICW